ncbi:RNA-binding cell elongation regulator Jag/EloR [Lactiplantibacillus plajomi]|uniref:RNA-binding protein KhpB n=1 Tax=Lactiplantibacillus plajomi TaxID=1457217 RepID=A0ABV6K4F0_9LACO|nr:RNA-binding cell elongation regulator Jag/EloR [Lactiplantibacillus plajomi]
MTVFEGNTVEAAIAAGLKAMQVTRDQVTIDVVAEPKKGFLGLGKKPAQVKLTAVPASAAPAPKKPAAPKVTVQPQLKVTPAPKVKPAAVIQTQAGIKTTAAPKKPAVAKQSPAAKATKAAKSATIKSAKKADQPARTADQAIPVRSPQEIAARQAANEQAVRDLSAYLLEIVKQLGIVADLDVDFGNRHATLNFDTAKQGLLIGKHGRTINALQDLAQVYMNHHGASHVNVVLDVDDYRERRAATLKRLAESTAREAIATGKQVFLDPMPSFERKLIHAELANNRHVTTFSEGRDPHRAVVVTIRK